MPVREGLPASERWRHVPPRDTTTGSPEHPVEYRAVIGPPATATRDLVRQQRLKASPLRIGQIVSMQHPPGLPHPALKIRGTRSSRLSPTPSERERRLLHAVSAMLLAGDRRQAAAFAEDIAGFPRGPLRDKVLGYLAYIDDRPHEAERWLRSAWEQCDPAKDRPLAAAIALTNLLHWKHRLYGQEAVEWGRTAVDLAAPVGDPV